MSQTVSDSVHKKCQASKILNKSFKLAGNGME